MRYFYTTLIVCLFFSFTTIGQNTMTINAELDVETKSIHIEQNITYLNDSNKTLDTIFLTDWSHSYSTKNSPLATRFAEEFKNTFHFAKNEDRGFTVLSEITAENKAVTYSRLKNNPDIIAVALNTPLLPQKAYHLNLKYTLQIPNDKFTRYGVTDSNDYNLRFWYITPAVFDGKWHYFSNKDLNDAYVPKSNITLQFTYPTDYSLISELNTVETTRNTTQKTTRLQGDARINSRLFLNKINTFKTVETDFLTIQSNIDDEGLEATRVALATDKVSSFITSHLGNYPHDKLLLTAIDYKKDPIYGLNLLPSFIRPFPDTFQYELKVLKTGLRNFLENTILINPREEQWVIDGIQTYLLIKYIDTYYPDIKLTGTLGNIWGIRAFHAADLKFNDQYNLGYIHMARTHLDQPLNMAKDSLLKFNENIANKYKAGAGLRYLDDYTNSALGEKAIAQFVKDNALKPTKAETFIRYLEANTDKNIDWFYSDYVSTNEKIDFKIKHVKKVGDSLHVTLQNRRDNLMPVSIYTIKNDSVIAQQWIPGFRDTKIITIANSDADRLAVNYNKTIPEVNTRNNWKRVNTLLDKPIQFRLFKDIEDPDYSQIFFMPEFAYNFYDGFSPGLKLYNKTVLSKDFLYKFSPKYAFKSDQLVGSAYFSYANRKEDSKHYYTRYTLRGEYYNYAPNLSYTSFTPSVSFRFRNPDDLRKNKKQFLDFRYINIDREIDLTGEFQTEGEPKYSVFNASYTEVNPNLKNYSSWNTDLQIAKNFGKLSTTLEFRTLTENNRQYNLRAYFGTFIYNKTYQDTDFFSFALDRPTDYLFDYDYLGRTEEAGLLSQQLIIAEGGFKSQLDTPFANQWISTVNTSTTIWRYVMAYADAGLIKNHDSSPEFVYDTGIRLNLVEDYFELYFPIYSNKGWEISQPEYDKSIRFIVTLSPNTLLKLFTRRWY